MVAMSPSSSSRSPPRKKVRAIVEYVALTHEQLPQRESRLDPSRRVEPPPTDEEDDAMDIEGGGEVIE